ncbi:MAG TPA: hypothetical protein VJ248_06240, partial [Candidatus Udaeobacter sp.]|nr:hypothetical protein [Candidatus Udaeobacter sp.]
MMKAASIIGRLFHYSIVPAFQYSNPLVFRSSIIPTFLYSIFLSMLISAAAHGQTNPPSSVR